MPEGSVVVVTTSGAAIVIDSCFVAVCAGEPESVAVTVNANVPADVGVPLIAPPELSESPAAACPAGPST